MNSFRKEEYSKKSIFSEIQRRISNKKALIPKNLNIHRRSTQHNRIEKSFEDAYNISPRSRVTKMQATRAFSQSKPCHLFLTNSSSSLNSNRKKICSIKNEIIKRVLNNCEKEKANNHKLLDQVNGFRKTIDQDLSILERLKVGYIKSANRMKENTVN